MPDSLAFGGAGQGVDHPQAHLGILAFPAWTGAGVLGVGHGPDGAGRNQGEDRVARFVHGPQLLLAVHDQGFVEREQPMLLENGLLVRELCSGGVSGVLVGAVWNYAASALFTWRR